MERVIKRRRKKKYHCPNPLFEKWLTEWRDSAAKNGLKTQFIFAKALTSLKKYPIPLSSGKEAKILEFFGDKICLMLDEKLQQYQLEECPIATVMSEADEDVFPSEIQTSRKQPEVGQNQCITVFDGCHTQGVSKNPKKHQGKKNYIPTPRSGSHALLIALYNFEMSNNNSVKKAELITAAQPLCDSSFTVPLPGSHYTSWNCMGQLIRKRLIEKKSNPAWYSLTDSGRQLAIKLLKETEVSSLAVSKKTDICNANITSCNEDDEELLQMTISTLHPIIMLNSKRSLITDKKEQKDCRVRKDFANQYSANYDEKTYQHFSSLSNSCSNNVPSSQALSHNTDSGFASSCSSSSTIATSPSVQNTCKSTTDNIASSVERFSLIPENFDVLLCVDSCETISGAIKHRETLLAELRKNGIDFQVRKLNVGDFLWIAQERIYHHMETDMTPRELVLDFVVERKRMDDLSSSIKDGRFREQKFRLRNCGARRLVYLVEECSASKYCGIPESALEQAIANTQVVDGFTIKRTKDIKESIAYLTLMTRFLQNLYKHQILVSGSREEIQNSSCPLNMFMTYKEFNSTAVKNKCLQVKEMFAKHLLQLYGLSVDKAAVIIEKYETPAKLFEAYNSCASEEEKIKLLSILKCGKTKRNFGISLSKTVYQLYCTEGSLS